MSGELDSPFTFEDDPDAPGWRRWHLRDTERFNALLGPISVKVEDGIARVRMQPAKRLSNLNDKVHGGALLAFIDVALFAAGRGFGVLSAGGAVTLELSTSFVGAADLDRPVEARVELLRETGQLLFERGLIVQGEETIASFNATLRKFRPA
jgi:uncharacterized protein (TIGR00369 family)